VFPVPDYIYPIQTLPKELTDAERDIITNHFKGLYYKPGVEDTV
jgi:hypothetical protein